MELLYEIVASWLPFVITVWFYTILIRLFAYIWKSNNQQNDSLQRINSLKSQNIENLNEIAIALEKLNKK